MRCDKIIILMKTSSVLSIRKNSLMDASPPPASSKRPLGGKDTLSRYLTMQLQEKLHLSKSTAWLDSGSFEVRGGISVFKIYTLKLIEQKRFWKGRKGGMLIKHRSNSLSVGREGGFITAASKSWRRRRSTGVGDPGWNPTLAGKFDGWPV